MSDMLRRQSNPRERGAVMLVVILVILMITSTGIFAAHSTSAEIRASGFSNQLMRTQYMGEAGIGATLAWIDVNTPDGLDFVLNDTATRNAGTGPVLDLAPFEPPLSANRRAHRFYAADFEQLRSGGGLGGVDGREWNTRDRVLMDNTHNAFVIVDVYDDFALDGGVAGYEEGSRTLVHLGATFTSRGRSRVADVDDAILNDASNFIDPSLQPNPARAVLYREHETASDARAFGMMGPLRR